MRPMGESVRSLALTAALLSGAGTALLRGGDDDDLVDVRSRDAPKVQNPFAAVGRVMIDARNLDAWIYGNQFRGPGWLEASLRSRVDEMSRVCGLSETQTQKLVLAGQGDIQRFVKRVDELKAECQTGGIPADQYNKVFQKTRPLSASVHQGLFGADSLFHKTLLTALRPEQIARCEEIDRERRTFRYRARVELCVAQLDSVVGLSEDQRRRLVQLILDKTRPPRSSSSQFERFVVLAQMSRLPQETLKAVFDPGQWREVEKRLSQAKRMLPTLRANGVVFDEDAESAKQADGGAKLIRAERRVGD
jgi:hypothetical protein